MKRQRIITEQSQTFTFTRRAFVLGGAQTAVGLLLAGRMGWLAIAENERYNTLSESNRVQLTLVPPRRGWWDGLDADAANGAFWLLLDLERRTATWRRAPYDPTPARDRARALGLA